MAYMLFLISIISFLAGFAVMVSAENAIHEIEAFVLFIVSSVLLSGSAIVDVLKRIEKKLETKPEQGLVQEKLEWCFDDVEKGSSSPGSPRLKEDVGDKPPIRRLSDDPNRPGIIRAQCNGCQKVLIYKNQFSGRKTSCPDCKIKFVLP